jgi:hypothetical protein
MIDDVENPGKKKKVTEYGREAVAAATQRHIAGTSAFDLEDLSFDNDFAREVEDAIRAIRASESAGPRPLPSCALSDLCYDPPTIPELLQAKEKLKDKIKGSPGVDDIMASMLLWGPPELWDTILS